MNRLIIYHGSDKIIEHPKYGYGRRYNDYGIGFYCTVEEDMAKEWAVSADRGGFANKYALEISDLSVLNLNDEKYCALHWLAVLLENRTFEINTPLAAEAKRYLTENYNTEYSRYDVITGYRADDSYFAFAQDFISGAISYRQLCTAMHLGKLGEQTVLKSRKAFEHVTFLGYTSADKKYWYEKKKHRDNNARKAYFNMRNDSWRKNDLYIIQIIDEEITPGDLRLTDIGGNM